MIDRLRDLYKYAEVGATNELRKSDLTFQFAKGTQHLQTRESNVDEEAAVANDTEFMTDFFRQVERIQMSIRKIESDTHVLQENFNERLVKINPADRRSKFIRRLGGLEITIWYVRQWISSSEANSLLREITIAVSCVIYYIGLGQESEKLVTEINRTSRDVKNKLEEIAKNDPNSTHKPFIILVFISYSSHRTASSSLGCRRKDQKECPRDASARFYSRNGKISTSASSVQT